MVRVHTHTDKQAGQQRNKQTGLNLSCADMQEFIDNWKTYL